MNNTIVPIQRDADGIRILNPTYFNPSSFLFFFLPILTVNYASCSGAHVLTVLEHRLSHTKEAVLRNPCSPLNSPVPKNSLDSLPLSLPTAGLPSRHTFSWQRFRKVLLRAERWKLQGCVCLDTIKHTQTHTVSSDSERHSAQGLLYRTGQTLWLISSFYQFSRLISTSSRWFKNTSPAGFNAPACQNLHLKTPSSTLSSTRPHVYSVSFPFFFFFPSLLGLSESFRPWKTEFPSLTETLWSLCPQFTA